MLTRRALIGAASAAATGAAATGALAGCEPDRESDRESPRGLDPGDWRSVRDQFRIDRGLAQLAAFVFASHPAPVREAIERHRAGLDADPVGYLRTREGPAEEAVLAAAVEYLEAKAEHLAFTDSTTMGLGLLYSGLALAPGDEILTTEHDFYATHEALRLRSERDGAVVRRVRLYDRPAATSVDGVVRAVLAGLTPKTRVLALTWVHSSTGVRLPIPQIAEAVRRRAGDRVLICVDGVHGLGAVDAAPAALGADFLVSGTHKWLFGPRGTGVVWGSEAGWARYTPVIPTFDPRGFVAWMGDQGPPVAPGAAATPGGYHSFEHRWALAEAFTFASTLGRPRVAGRVTELASALKAGLAGVAGVDVHTPTAPELSAGIVCCEVEGVPAVQAVERLRAAKVAASVTPYAEALLRLGPSIVNDEADVERAIAAVRDL
jgi:selenocysteine lyase/cysteine desulfurase